MTFLEAEDTSCIRPLLLYQADLNAGGVECLSFPTVIPLLTETFKPSQSD